MFEIKISNNLRVRVLVTSLLIIIVGLLVQIFLLNRDLDQAQRIVDTFSIDLDTVNFESAQSVKDTWWEIVRKNNYTITGKFCDKDESGTCVE